MRPSSQLGRLVRGGDVLASLEISLSRCRERRAQGCGGKLHVNASDNLRGGIDRKDLSLVELLVCSAVMGNVAARCVQPVVGFLVVKLRVC